MLATYALHTHTRGCTQKAYTARQGLKSDTKRNKFVYVCAIILCHMAKQSKAKKQNQRLRGSETEVKTTKNEETMQGKAKTTNKAKITET